MHEARRDDTNTTTKHASGRTVTSSCSLVVRPPFNSTPGRVSYKHTLNNATMCWAIHTQTDPTRNLRTEWEIPESCAGLERYINTGTPEAEDRTTFRGQELNREHFLDEAGSMCVSNEHCGSINSSDSKGGKFAESQLVEAAKADAQAFGEIYITLIAR